METTTDTGRKPRLGPAMAIAGGAAATASAALTWWTVGEEEVLGIPFPELQIAGLHSWHGVLTVVCGAILVGAGALGLARPGGLPALGAAVLAAGGAILVASLLGLGMPNASVHPWLFVAAAGGTSGVAGGLKMILDGTHAPPEQPEGESWRT